MHPSQSVSSTPSNFVNTCQITTSSIDTFFPQVVQIANAKEQPSTSQNIFPLTKSEKRSEEFQFNVEREAVDNAFWSKFKEKLDKQSFNQLFSDFLLTNWMPKENYEHSLKRMKAVAAKRKEDGEEYKAQDIITDYNALVQMLLHVSLKLSAMSTIYDILELGDLNSQLNDALLTEKAEIIRKRNRKINYIDKQYNLNFAKVYLSYQAYLEKADHEKTAIDIIAFRRHLYSQKRSVARYQKKAQDAQLMKKHLPFINECLYSLRLHQKLFTYMGKNTPIQEQEAVPAKKRKLSQSVVAVRMDSSLQSGISDLQEGEQTEAVDMPSTSTESLYIPNISTESTEEVKLKSLLNKIIGRDTYTYYEINVDDKKNEDVIKLEEYYQSSIMLYALNAKALLLKIKILTAKLIQTEAKSCKNTLRRKLSETFSEFMKSHFAYEKNMEMLLHEKMNERSINIPISGTKKNDKDIKIASTLLKSVQQEYDTVIQHCDENILLKCYFEFINSSMVMRIIMDSYSLSHEKINQITHSILNFLLPTNLTKEQLLTLKFQSNRPFVDNFFWQNLKNENLSKSEFERCYFNFILTNWKSSPEETGKLDKCLTEAINSHIDSQIRANLIEKHFRVKLRNQAFMLIHHILQLIKKYQRITSLSLKNKVKNKRIKTAIEKHLVKINENYQKASVVHSDYLMARKSFDNVDINQLYDEISTCKNYMYANKFDTEDTEVNILLINKILDKIEKDGSCSRVNILELVSDYMNDGIFSAPTLTAAHIIKQLQFVSVSDITSLQSEAFAKPSTFYPQQDNMDLQYQENLHVYPSQQSQLLENESASTSSKSIAYFAEEKKITCLLNKLTEKDTYVHYDLNIDEDIKNKNLIVTSEKHYHSLIMFFALNAKTLLLRMKILIAKLIQAENKIKGNKYHILRKLADEFSTFIGNHLSYEEKIAISLDERINQRPVGMSDESMREHYFDTYKNIKITNAFFTEVQQEYNEIIQNCDEKILQKRYIEFINSSLIINKIKDSYSLSYGKINRMIQSFFNIPQVLNLTEEQFLTLKFQIDRTPVNNSFWQTLKNENLTEFKFKRYYFDFIFTSWKSSPNEIRELEKKIKGATDLSLQLRVNLVEKHFQEKMRYQAFYFIHHILQVINKYNRLKTLPTNSDIKKGNLEHEIEDSLSKIKENAQKAFRIYSDYLAARASLESVDINKLYAEIKTCNNYVNSNSKADSNNTVKYILLVNKIIDNIEKNELFTHAMVLEPIRDYMVSNETLTVPETTTIPKDYTIKLSQFVPAVQASSFVATPQLALANKELAAQEPQSLAISSSATLDMQLDGPFLNFSTENTQPSTVFETLESSISFPLPLIAERQMANVVKSNAQSHEQVLPSTSQNLYLLATLSEQYSEQFQFNIKRDAVDDKFWSEFKKDLEQTSFNELFNHFILTNWEPTEAYKHALKRAHSIRDEKEMPSEKDITVFHYDALVEVFLCVNLKLRATTLIHAIMDLASLNSQQDKSQLDNKVRGINNQYCLAFSKVYPRYQEYLKKTNAQKTAADIIALKHQITSLKSSISRCQKEIRDVQLMEIHLLFINRCLTNLRLYEKIPNHSNEHSIPAQAIETENMDIQYQIIMQSLYPSISALGKSQLLESKNASTSRVSENTAQYQNETPSTSVVGPDIYPIELNKSDLYGADEIKFISFLNKMIGKDNYFYRKINVNDDERHKRVVPKEYYYSLIMLSALNAQILLLKMQILTSKLVLAETETQNNLQAELHENFSIFMNNHLIYEKNIAILRDQKIYDRPVGMSVERMKHDYFSNCTSIKIMNAMYANVLQEYSNTIQFYNKNMALKHYIEFICSPAVASEIQSSYSLSNKKISEIIQVVLFDIPSSPTPASTLTQHSHATQVFQIDRPHVDDSFWQALMNENLSESDFSRCYFRFIFTNWRSPLDEVFQLEKAIKQAFKYDNFDLQLRINLIEKHFQEKLRYQASQLIHHILQVIKQHRKLNNSRLSKTESEHADRRKKMSLIKVRENFQKALKIHSDYLAVRRSPETIGTRKFFSEIKIYQRHTDFHAKTDAEDIKLYILLLNEILKKNESFSYSALLELIDDVDDEASTSKFLPKQVRF